MAILKLAIDEFESTDYELIAIHSQSESHKVAFIINKTLRLQLHIQQNIEVQQKNGNGSLTHFRYDDEKNERYWDLIENKTHIATAATTGLFTDYETAIYLVPELKNVDYLLKIEAENISVFIDDILQRLLECSVITTSYKIDVTKIKSKHNLIF